MTTITGGHGLGLQDGSYALLNRNDTTSRGTLGHGVESLVNVANGNLLLQEVDAFLPSQGEDFRLIRTYDSRGKLGSGSDGWILSTAVTLSSHQDTLANSNSSQTSYTVTYGDGSTSEFALSDARNGIYTSTDGAGAYEALRVLSKPDATGVQFTLTRADQSQLSFDKSGLLRSSVDTNGVRMEYVYQSGRLQQVRDDTGHVITYNYSGSKLASITESFTEGGVQRVVTLVTYTYASSQLVAVTDRAGHTTRYTYNNAGLLESITLPTDANTPEARTIRFTYQQVNWDDHPHFVSDFDKGSAWVLSSVTDAMSAVTTFGYQFDFRSDTVAAADRDKFYKFGGGRYFAGGTTRVTDALGHVVAYSYDADGYLTKVVDADGHQTTYTYSNDSLFDKDNLTSTTDSNGWAAITRDTAHYLALRQDLGFVYKAGDALPPGKAIGDAKLVASLTQAEKDAILARFTTTFTYDARGNLLSRRDGAGNLTTYTYTSFNKVASMTAPMGDALATSDEASYQAKRVELGFAATVAGLSAANKAALRALYTTTYTYDAKQNLATRTDPGGDVTQFAYDAFGNVTRRTVVYRGANGVANAAKNQVTQYAYDAFGNNVRIADGEGKVATQTFDRFGNVLTSTDARGNTSVYTYDNDNRLLSAKDAEGNLVINVYDAVGNRIAITDANGLTVTQVFDRNNLLITTIDPSTSAALTRTTQFKYDVVGNRTEVTDAEGRKTTYTFDASRRLVDVATPEVLSGSEQLVPHHESYAYDGEGNVVTLTDRNGNVTQTLYTNTGLIRRITDATGNVAEYLYDANLQQVQLTLGAQLAPALRRVLRFGRDEENQIVSTTDAMGGVTRNAYDAPGNIVSITDANGNRTDYDYDRNNRLLKETHASVIDPVTQAATRYTVVHAYDANGNETSTTDENGKTRTYAFDKNDRQVLVTDANGIKTVYAYDSRGNTTRISIGVAAHVDAAGKVVIDSVEGANVTSLVYDEFNQLVAQTDGVANALVDSDAPLYQQMRVERGLPALKAALTDAQKAALRAAFTETYAYDRVGNLTTLTDHRGIVTTVQYDALDREQRRVAASGSPEQVVTESRYDGNGNLVKQTLDPDDLARVTRFAYDAEDRLTDRTDPAGVVTHTTYDNVGNRTSVTQAFGTDDARTTRFEYDLNDRIVRTLTPEGRATAFEYDPVGNRVKVTDAKNGVRQYFYDALNRNVRVIDALSFETRYEYDGVSNRIAIVDARGNRQRFIYDPGNRYIETTDAEGVKTRFEYDALDNVVKQTTAFDSPEARTTTFVYDAEGNLRSTTDAKGGVATEGYDDAYNKTGTTDANGRTTGYSYDALNRQIRITDALGGQTSYTYDAAGNRLTEIDALGRERSFEYDENNRLIVETDPLLVETHYEYDPFGQQISITRAANTPLASTARFEYDQDGLLRTETDALGHARTYTYDANQNVETVTDQNGHTTVYGYDANNRLTSVTDALGNATTFKYDANGNRVQVIDAENHATTTFYDKNNRVAWVVDGERFATRREYDRNGNLVAETLHMTRLASVDPNVVPVPVASAADQRTQYQYDELNRVTARIDPMGGIRRYTYDAVGNTKSETDENLGVTTYAYDELNRLTQTVDPLGYVTTFAYDKRGNLLRTTRGLSLTDPDKVAVTRHAYDELDRLIATLSAEGYLSLRTYDAAGYQTVLTEFDNRFAPNADGTAPITGSGQSRVTQASYDLNGSLRTETSALGIVTRYEYDRVGNRTAKIEADGRPEARRSEIRYDAANRIEETVDAAGIVTHTERDGAGNAIAVFEAFGTDAERVTRFEHDGNNRVTKETDALLIVTEHSYDGAGNLLSTTRGVDLPDERTVRFEYDANNRQTAQINGENERTEFAYDALGNRTQVTVAPGRPEQRVNRFRYDLDNRLVAEVDGNGVETQYRYDGAGNKLELIQLAAAYDSAGNPVSTYQGQPIAGQDRHTTFTYDLDNRLTRVVDPLGGETLYEHDALGNQTKITDANGGVTENTFDAAGRLLTNLVRGAERGGVLVANDYDAFDNVVRTRRSFADGFDARQIAYGYDKLDRQTTITGFDRVEQLTPTTVFREAFSTVIDYDAFGNQTKLAYGLYLPQPADTGYDAAKAALAHPLVATFDYDALDRLESTTDGVNNTIAYENDIHGNRTSQTTGSGTPDARTVRFIYDQADRLVRRETQAGGIVTLAYDEAGNQTQKRTLQSGTENTPSAVWMEESFAYDGNGRVITETDALGTVTEHLLDAFGNEVETRFAADTTDERVLKSEYNKNNDLVAETDAMNFRSVYQVDKLGNRIAQTDPRGHTTRLYFNERNQNIATLDPEGYLTTFGYDAAGNVTATNVYLDQYTAPANPLVAPAPAGADPVRTTTYEYDGANDRVRETAADGAVTEYAYDSARKLVQITQRGSDDAALLARTTDAVPRVQTFKYDLAGRLSSFQNADGTIETYDYDSANNKTQETVANATPLPGGGADPERVTRFRYDDDNRLVTQTFDPDGLNRVETLAYDKAGNVVRRTDANGNATTSSYDLANRLLSVTDALGQTTFFTYDRVGNQRSLTDGRGNTIDFEYDNNDRLKKEILPAVDVFTIAGGLLTDVRPTNVRFYDAAGNLTQLIEGEIDGAGGIKTTRYYDGNNLRIAEIDGDNVLRTFTYDAAGAQTSATLYMTPLASSAHDSPTPPTAPGGESRTVRSFYDAAGRLIRTEYPQIEVTTLAGTGGSSPTFSAELVTPDEQHEYDAFGNHVRSIDRNGNSSHAYFDKLGRTIATVDAGGYLVESTYDSQGNVVQQRKYAQALATVSAGVKPTAPAGDVDVVDRIFDTANRLIEEISPNVKVGETAEGADVLERVRTTYGYDANGNQIRRTIAAGSTDAATEHYYFDAINQRVAVVTAGRTLNTFKYDANGNRTELTRYFDALPDTLDLAQATPDTLLDEVTADAAHDETTQFAYDKLNRLVRESDLMGAGVDDDVTTASEYDAVGNLTQRTDALGNTSRIGYDARGNVTQTLSPNGAASFIEYDAAGLKVRAWTGGLPGQSAQQATGVAASAGGGLTISWQQPGADSQSWVVWDTSPHDVTGKPNDAYPNETGHVGSGPVSVTIPGAAGTVVFFRVVSQDSAGNLAWTEERSATIPPGIQALSVAQLGSDFRITVRFNASVEAPVLRFGPASGSLSSNAPFVAQPDGSYVATIANPADPQALAFQVEWQSNGQTLSSGVTTLEAGGEHDAVGNVIAIPVPQDGGVAVGNGQLVLVDGVRNDTAQRVNDDLQFDPQLTTNGMHRYDVFFGSLAAADHSVTLTSHAHQSTVQSEADTVETDEDGNITSVVRHLEWEQTYETHVEVTLGAGEVPAGPVIAATKPAGSGIAFDDQVALTAANGVHTGTFELDPGEYDVKIYYLDAAGREVIVEWRRITVAEAELPESFDVTDDTGPFDFVGQEGEIDQTADVDDPAGTRSYTGRSLTVLASETDGSIDRQGAAKLEVDAGLYLGPLAPEGSASPIALDTSASSGAGSLSTDGLQSQTYYTEIRYNALSAEVASNEQSGVWRTFGVDALGNAVLTRLYGTEADETADLAGEPGHEPILSFTAFDALNRQVATFDAATAVVGSATAQRAVTRTTYDYAGRVASVLDPGDATAQQFRYDGVGNLIAFTDALGHTTKRSYTRRGDIASETDPLGNRRTYEYDADGNLTRETNEVGDATTHAYDAFGRRTQTTNALGHATGMDYDQRDRLVAVTDALGNATQRYFDKRDNEIWLQDANNNWFGKAYDAMGRLTHEYSFFNAGPTSFDEAQAALDENHALHEELIDVATSYDVFGNKLVKTDANGRREIFAYGAFGRVVRRSVEDVNFNGPGPAPIAFSSTTEYDRFGGVSAQTSTQGQNITRSYDEAGRLVEINDLGTGVKTTYGYHLNGKRGTETIEASGSVVRDIVYSYDANDRLERWADSVTGENLNYTFDEAGNVTEVYNDARSIDHTYDYDDAGRLIAFNQGSGDNTYTYDDAGNRIEWNENGTIHTYEYDDAGRVQRERDANSLEVQRWEYDNVGNVTQHASDGKVSTNTFLANYLVSQSTSGTQTTTTTYDKTGRPLSQTLVDAGSNFTYTFEYNADGTQASITGQGDGATGSSQSTYDVNQRLTRLDLGQGNDQDGPEFRTFAYNNDGQILTRFQDDGRSSTPNPTTNYFYANGHAVAEIDDLGNRVADAGPYDLAKIIGEAVPADLVLDRVVQAGETLQSIAAQVYGNPSLWFVIADANGLSGSESLREGMHLKIPNTVQIGRITDETHAIYREGDVVGSKLPNLKSPPPPQSSQQAAGADNCAAIGAIIVTVVIAIAAIAATILTAGLLAPLAATAIGLSTTFAVAAFTVAFTAVAGAVIGFAASAATQGFNILFGVQDEFDWKQVAIDTVAGFVGGAVGALGQVAATAVKGAQLGIALTRIARVALMVGEAAVEVGVEAASQATADNGRIEQPWMLGVAVAGVGVGELLSKGIKLIGKGANAVAEAIDDAVDAGKRVSFQQADGTVVSKSTSKVAAKPKDAPTTIKSVDSKINQGKPGDLVSLSLKDPGEVFKASGKKPGWNDTTWVDTAASTLTSVPNPSKLSNAPKADVLNAANLLNVGQLKDFDSDTIFGFASGTVGKVKDAKVSIDLLAGSKGVGAKKALTGDDLSLPAQADGKIATGADATAKPAPQPAPTLLPPQPATSQQKVYQDDPHKALDGLLKTRAAKPQDAPDVALPDYNDIPARYYLPKTINNAPLPKGAKRFLADTIGSEERATRRLREGFQQVFNHKANFKNPNNADGPKITRYERFAADLETRIKEFGTGFKLDVKGGAGIDYPANPALAKKLDAIAPEQLVAIRGYTDADVNNNPIAAGSEDYRNVNTFLRGDVADPTRAEEIRAGYDAYIRLATQGIAQFDQYQGTTFRGLTLDDASFDKQFQEGGTWIGRSFLSSAANPKSAFGGGQASTLLVLNSRTGRSVEALSLLPHEREVLFPPGSKWKVLRVEKFPDVQRIEPTDQTWGRIVYLDEIPSGT